MPILRPRIVGGDIRVSDGRISAAAGTGKDRVISAITKWIPVEVIAFCQGITIPFGGSLAHGLWFGIPFGTVVTGLWIAFATKSTQAESPIAWRQVYSHASLSSSGSLVLRARTSGRRFCLGGTRG